MAPSEPGSALFFLMGYGVALYVLPLAGLVTGALALIGTRIVGPQRVRLPALIGLTLSILVLLAPGFIDLGAPSFLEICKFFWG